MSSLSQPIAIMARGGGGLGFGSALVLAVLAAGAGAAGGALGPRVPEVNALLDRAIPPPGQTAAETASVTETAALDTRLDAIEAVLNTPLAQAASAGPEGADVAARVFALQSGLREVETRLGRMPSTDEVAALVAEVQQLQQDLPAVAAEARTAAQAATAAFAVAAAGDASRSSGPFEQEFAALQALLPNDPNVQQLAPARPHWRADAGWNCATPSRASTTISSAPRAKPKRRWLLGPRASRARAMDHHPPRRRRRYARGAWSNAPSNACTPTISLARSKSSTGSPVPPRKWPLPGSPMRSAD
ncbi:MAG: hypothetical protein WDM79_03390 [Terricaulis sp.]